VGNATGKLIAKFERVELKATANDTVTINCVGEIVVGEETFRVQGSDTLRVMGGTERGELSRQAPEVPGVQTF
jgi:hypothetical protein